MNDSLVWAAKRVRPGRSSGGALGRTLRSLTTRTARSRFNPPWSRVQGKCLVNFHGMLPSSGSIIMGVHSGEVPSALMLSPGWPQPEFPKAEPWVQNRNKLRRIPEPGSVQNERRHPEPLAVHIHTLNPELCSPTPCTACTTRQPLQPCALHTDTLHYEQYTSTSLSWPHPHPEP